MNGKIDIVTRRTLKPDWQVNAEKDKNGGAKLEAGNLSNQDPLEAERVALLAITKKLVTAWQQERDALQRAQEIKDTRFYKEAIKNDEFVNNFFDLQRSL